MTALGYMQQFSSKRTVWNYNAALRDFFEIAYGQRDPLEELAEQYVRDEDRDREEDIQRLIVTLKDKNLAPKSIRLKITALRTFLIENEIELSQTFWRRLRSRIKGNRALTVDRIPTHREFRDIFNHLPIQGKALFTVLLSSGMRIGEALQITPGDVNLDADPVRVNVRGGYTKTGNRRVTFVSREAKETLLQWLQVRREYLEAAVAKTPDTITVKDGSTGRKTINLEKSLDDPRLFPFSHSTAYHMWNNALRKADLEKRDSRTRYHKLHPHVLRKFFRTKLGAAISPDVVEALMGHEEYLEAVYRRHSVEDLARFYKQGEQALLVFTEAGEVSKLRKEVTEQRNQLQTIVNGLTAENMTLRAKVERQELEMEKLRTKQNNLVSMVDRLLDRLEEHERLPGAGEIRRKLAKST